MLVKKHNRIKAKHFFYIKGDLQLQNCPGKQIWIIRNTHLYSTYASVAHGQTHKNELYNSAIPHFGSTLNFGLALPFCVLTEIWIFFWTKCKNFNVVRLVQMCYNKRSKPYFDIKGYLKLHICPGKQIWI